MDDGVRGEQSTYDYFPRDVRDSEDGFPLRLLPLDDGADDDDDEDDAATPAIGPPKTSFSRRIDSTTVARCSSLRCAISLARRSSVSSRFTFIAVRPLS